MLKISALLILRYVISATENASTTRVRFPVLSFSDFYANLLRAPLIETVSHVPQARVSSGDSPAV